VVRVVLLLFIAYLNSKGFFFLFAMEMVLMVKKVIVLFYSFNFNVSKFCFDLVSNKFLFQSFQGQDSSFSQKSSDV